MFTEPRGIESHTVGMLEEVAEAVAEAAQPVEERDVVVVEERGAEAGNLCGHLVDEATMPIRPGWHLAVDRTGDTLEQ